jgi:hypothetical protein
MSANVDALLNEWRAEIAAEVEGLCDELVEKQESLAAAEVADRAHKAQQRALHARINTALNGNQAATVLALHLESAMRDTTGGAVTKLRGEIAELDRRLADCRNALQQIELALALPNAVLAEVSSAAA